MIREVIYKLVRKSTSLRKKKKKKDKIPPPSLLLSCQSTQHNSWFYHLVLLKMPGYDQKQCHISPGPPAASLGYLLLWGYLKAWKTWRRRKPKEGEQEPHVASHGDKTMLALKPLS